MSDDHCTFIRVPAPPKASSASTYDWRELFKQYASGVRDVSEDSDADGCGECEPFGRPGWVNVSVRAPRWVRCECNEEGGCSD
jgi:hypothetical protein